MTALINLANLTKQIAERPHSLRIRKLFFIIHMTLGLAASVYLSAISLTGCLLVFREELERVLVSEPRITTRASWAPLSSIVESVERANPGFRVSGLIFSLEDDRATRVYAVRKGDYISFLVNPYDSSIIGTLPENGFLKFIQQLHFNLIMGQNGRKLNSFGGLLLCLISLSGIVLWWRGNKSWMNGLKVNFQNGTAAAFWHLHQAIGILVAPLLVVWGLSAINFGFRAQFESAVNLIMPVAALGTSREKTVSPQLKAVGKSRSDSDSDSNSNSNSNSGMRAAFLRSLDLIIPTAGNACPSQRLVRISTPSEANATAKVWLTTVQSYKKDDNTEVDIDTTTNKIVSVSVPSERRGGDAFLLWLTRLHFGNFGGLPIKVLWSCLGLSPLILALSGISMWWRRQKSKKQS